MEQGLGNPMAICTRIGWGSFENLKSIEGAFKTDIRCRMYYVRHRILIINVRCRIKHTTTKFTYDIVRHIRYRMSTYDIVHDIRYGIRYAHTISYITDIRYRMYLQTYDIVYVMYSLCSTISYVVLTTSHVDIRYRKNIRYRTYDIVCPTMQYRIYDIVHTIWYTTSNT